MLNSNAELSAYFNKLNAMLPEKTVGLRAEILATPLGNMLAVWSDSGLCLLEFVGQVRVDKELRDIVAAKRMRIEWGGEDGTLHGAQLQQQLDAYFSGSLKKFDVALDFVGTDFQQRVWSMLCQIPYGETMSYKEQALALDNPRAVRAVAAANGQNKISIIVPCHRVIGSDGKLTGYAGGLPRKQALLRLEAEHRLVSEQSRLF